VVALMLDKYNRVYLQPRSKSLRTDAFWNSTAKAVLIHTATDLVKTTGYAGEHANCDTRGLLVYHDGPDYATGWGMVDAVNALAWTDTSRFKQDSLDQDDVSIYKTNHAYAGDLRVSLAWDDPPTSGSTRANCYQIKLLSDLDMHVLGADRQTIHYPWLLDTLPHPDTLPANGYDPMQPGDVHAAYRGPGYDRRNNVEVVDIDQTAAATYSIVVTGHVVATAQGLQRFSLVSDDSLWKDVGSTWLINQVNGASASQTITVTPNTYDVVVDAAVPAGATNVTLAFQAGGTLSMAPDATISVGSTGTITGAQSVLVGEYYTVDTGSDGTINEIGGRATFSGSVPCGTVNASQNITIQNATLNGCTRDYTAGGSINVGDGATLGDGTTLRG